MTKKRAYFEGMNQTLETLKFDWMTNDSTSDINDDWISWRDSFLAIAMITFVRKPPTVEIIQHGLPAKY